MSFPEEAGKVATSAIDGLKTNPSCLAAILLAAMMAAFTYFALQADAQRTHERAMAMLERCYPLEKVEELTKRHEHLEP